MTLFIGLILLLFYVVSVCFEHSPPRREWISHAADDSNALDWPQNWSNQSPDSHGAPKDGVHGEESPSHELHGDASLPQDDMSKKLDILFPGHSQLHQEVFSSSTQDRKFISIDFGGTKVMNPNILPHPSLANTWIIVAQRKNEEPSFEFKELVCEAIVWDDTLRCQGLPAALPIATTAGGKCEGDLSYFNLNVGPHDARVFFGPEQPYIVFGSNSMFTCFGQFIQAFPALAGWNSDNSLLDDFRISTELQRPNSWNKIEKNWFLFWDDQGRMYAHHDIRPKRVLAQIRSDGSAGPDLGPLVAASDEQCMLKYMPQVAPELESIHQATNSLRVTMCRSAGQGCIPNEDNTFLLTIYQHKTYYNFHSVYEPYIMVFQQQEPFRIHAMSRRPLWIHGRERHPESNTSDMFYVTSMSWKSRERRYSGFLDDEIFIAFGIEDEKAGGIDILASELLGDLGLCDDI